LEPLVPDIGAYDAKTHLPKLLERVQQGERFVITKHGRPVAELVPVAARDSARIRDAIADLRKGRQALADRGLRLADVLRPGETLRELAQSGHGV
jgi:prevent-host-death family protein